MLSEGHRLICAAKHSRAGIAYAISKEKAVRLEAFILIAAIVPAWLISSTPSQFLLLLASIIVLIGFEFVNTAIEQTCNAITVERREEIRIAKDCASAAVLMAGIAVGLCWIAAIVAALW